VLGLEGTRLWAATDLEPEARAAALAALVAGRRCRRLTVETVEDAPIGASPWLGLLADAGFHGDGERLLFDGHPGPRPERHPAP
jgi:hypothetical protein